jgi:hypothetical protein
MRDQSDRCDSNVQPYSCCQLTLGQRFISQIGSRTLPPDARQIPSPHNREEQVLEALKTKITGRVVA